MKKQEGEKSVRTKRMSTVARRKAPVAKRRVVRPSVRRPVQATPVRPETPVKKVRGTGAARLAENLVLLTLSYLVLLLVFWMAFAAYSLAVWQSIVPRVHEYRLSFAPAVLTDELPPAAPPDTAMDSSQRVGTTDGLLVIPSTVRDGNIYVPVGVPVMVTVMVPEAYANPQLSVMGAGGYDPLDETDGVTYSLGQDGTTFFTTTSSTLRSGMRIEVIAEKKEEGQTPFESKAFIVE
ncbi:hypothetical protein KBD18_02580 [Patescibacteria group bacterium]|nr:hypothetical protein [Patescibacteria group bacterium]